MDETFFATLYTEQQMSLTSATSTTCSPISPPSSAIINTAPESEVAPPDEFICPISLQPMVHPLTSRSGRSFERSAILNWLQEGSGVCPLTRQPLRPSDLIPNRQLETRIRFWRMENNIPEPTEEDDDFDAVSFLGFLPVGEYKPKEITSRRAAGTEPMNLRDIARAHLRAQASGAGSRSRSTLAVPVLVDASSSMARRPKEGRRNFLSRILKQSTDDLEHLPV